jgi:hypothetical protein
VLISKAEEHAENPPSDRPSKTIIMKGRMNLMGISPIAATNLDLSLVGQRLAKDKRQRKPQAEPQRGD